MPRWPDGGQGAATFSEMQQVEAWHCGWDWDETSGAKINENEDDIDIKFIEKHITWKLKYLEKLLRCCFYLPTSMIFYLSSIYWLIICLNAA